MWWWIFFSLFFLISVVSSTLLYFSLKRINGYENLILEFQKIIEFANKNNFPLYFTKYRLFKH